MTVVKNANTAPTLKFLRPHLLTSQGWRAAHLLLKAPMFTPPREAGAASPEGASVTGMGGAGTQDLMGLTQFGQWLAEHQVNWYGTWQHTRNGPNPSCFMSFIRF